MGFSLLVLAAGMGSRYGGLKQLDGFGPHNIPLLWYSVYDAIRAGCNKVVFVVREEFIDAFKETIGNKIQNRVSVEYVFQTIDAYVPDQFKHLCENRIKPRGTGHATLVAKDHIQEPFIVINADDLYGPDAYKQMSSFLSHINEKQIAMVGYVLENTISEVGSINRGICTINNGLLESIFESLGIAQNDKGEMIDSIGQKIDRKSIVSMNFWGFHPSVFEKFDKYFTNFLQSSGGQGEYFVPLVVNHLIRDEGITCSVIMSHDKWCGVSYKNDKEFVYKAIQDQHIKGIYPDILF